MLGAHAPKTLMQPTKDNPRGYFESTEVMKFNDQVLSSAGSRWNDWGEFNPVWFDSLVATQFRDSLGEIVKKEFGTAPLLLIKDPRISRFLPLWIQTLRDAGIASKVVIPVRHPLAVARSLEVRDHFGRNRSLLLWLRHVLEAESGSRHLPRSFVAYDQVLEDWHASARKIATDLQIVWPKSSDDTQLKISDFLTSELRNQPEVDDRIAGSSQLDHWVRETYQSLQQACERPLTPAEVERLDGIRRDFNEGSALYGPVVREHEKRVEALYADVKVKLAQSNQACESQTAKLAEVDRSLSENISLLAEQRREAEALRDRLEVVNLKLAKSNEDCQSQTARLVEVERRLSEDAAILAEQRREVEVLNARIEEQDRVERTMMEERAALNALGLKQAEDLAARNAEVLKLRAEAAISKAELAERSRALEERDEALAQLSSTASRLAAEAELASKQHEALQDALQERIAERDEQLAKLSEELGQLKSSMESQSMELQRALAAGELSSKVRFRETAKLTEMLFQREATIEELLGRVAELTEKLSSKESENAYQRRITSLAYRHACAEASLSRRLDAWQQAAQLYARVLDSIGSSRAWRLLSRVSKVQLPLVQDPDRDPAIESQIELLRASDLFDPAWYLERYPDAADGAMEPERHYLTVGAPLGHDPGPAFDSVAYLMKYPDVLQAAMNPLVHYLEYGQFESRTCSPPGQAPE